MTQFYPEVYLNLIIFSLFIAILSIELMAASSIIFRYEESRKKVIGYIIPIWEVTGTFFVFYVVNLEALVPSILPFIAYTFVSYILFFLIVYILRNASIISAEYVWKNRFLNKKLLYQLYAVVTFVLGAIVLMVYSAVISGAGINYAARSFSFLKFVSFLPNDGFIIGSAIILFGLASIFYSLNVYRWFSLYTVIAGLVIAGTSFISLGDMTNYFSLAIPFALTIAVPILNLKENFQKYLHNKIFFQGIIAISVFFLAYSQYPYILGKTLNINTVLNDSAMQTQIFYATIVGGFFLLVMSLLFFRIYSSSRTRAIAE